VAVEEEVVVDLDRAAGISRNYGSKSPQVECLVGVGLID
jgi:hypothetical protein